MILGYIVVLYMCQLCVFVLLLQWLIVTDTSPLVITVTCVALVFTVYKQPNQFA